VNQQLQVLPEPEKELVLLMRQALPPEIERESRKPGR
jgi:hypothetical protein